MKRFVLIFVICIGFGHIALADDLCLTDEKLVFLSGPLCESNNVVSVCLDSAGNNKVRYGSTDEIIIEFEAEIERCQTAYSGGGGLRLTFSNEEYVFSSWSKLMRICIGEHCTEKSWEETHEERQGFLFLKGGKRVLKQCSLSPN